MTYFLGDIPSISVLWPLDLIPTVERQKPWIELRDHRLRNQSRSVSPKSCRVRYLDPLGLVSGCVALMCIDADGNYNAPKASMQGLSTDIPLPSCTYNPEGPGTQLLRT